MACSTVGGDKKEGRKQLYVRAKRGETGLCQNTFLSTVLGHPESPKGNCVDRLDKYLAVAHEHGKT